MRYNNIVDKVSKDLQLPYNIVDRTYKAFWLYIRNTIQELPLKEDLNEAEFSMLKPNFNIPSLGKLTCTYNRYKNIKNRFNCIKKHEEVD